MFHILPLLMVLQLVWDVCEKSFKRPLPCPPRLPCPADAPRGPRPVWGSGAAAALLPGCEPSLTSPSLRPTGPLRTFPHQEERCAFRQVPGLPTAREAEVKRQSPPGVGTGSERRRGAGPLCRAPPPLWVLPRP